MSASCGHDHTGETGLSGPALARELDHARTLCAEHGERMTSSRERVLSLLLSAGAPMKAYDVIEAYDPGAATKPPTVYRALEFLERNGLAHRIESLGAFIACNRTGGHRAAFLICDCCGTAREFDPGEAGPVGAEARRDGFSISAMTVEAHGLCADCQESPRA